MYNTPPVFAVYTSLLTLQYLEQHGGIEAAEVRNEAKKLNYYMMRSTEILYSKVIL